MRVLVMIVIGNVFFNHSICFFRLDPTLLSYSIHKQRVSHCYFLHFLKPLL